MQRRALREALLCAATVVALGVAPGARAQAPETGATPLSDRAVFLEPAVRSTDCQTVAVRCAGFRPASSPAMPAREATMRRAPPTWLGLRALLDGVLALLFPPETLDPAEGELPILFSLPSASGETPLGARVRVERVSRGGEVALLGVTRLRTKGAYTTITRYRETLYDDDRDGTVDLDVEGEIPPHSVWAAVDLSTGSWGVRSAGVRLLPVRTSVAQFDTKTGEFELPGSFFEILWARPGVGAWIGEGVDGALTDGDAVEDGVFRGRLEDLLPMPAKPEPVPEASRRGDVVITINRLDLRTAVYRVTDEAP
jgi:hypothetical protein